MARKLTVVTEETTAPTKAAPPATIKVAITMSERDLLVAMRQKVASEIDSGVAAAYLAPLMRQLREVDKEIRALDAREREEAGSGGDVSDEAFDASAV